MTAIYVDLGTGDDMGQWEDELEQRAVEKVCWECGEETQEAGLRCQGCRNDEAQNRSRSNPQRLNPLFVEAAQRADDIIMDAQIIHNTRTRRDLDADIVREVVIAGTGPGSTRPENRQRQRSAPTENENVAWVKESPYPPPSGVPAFENPPQNYDEWLKIREDPFYQDYIEECRRDSAAWYESVRANLTSPGTTGFESLEDREFLRVREVVHPIPDHHGWKAKLAQEMALVYMVPESEMGCPVILQQLTPEAWARKQALDAGIGGYGLGETESGIRHRSSGSQYRTNPERILATSGDQEAKGQINKLEYAKKHRQKLLDLTCPEVWPGPDHRTRWDKLESMPSEDRFEAVKDLIQGSGDGCTTTSNPPPG